MNHPTLVRAGLMLAATAFANVALAGLSPPSPVQAQAAAAKKAQADAQAQKDKELLTASMDKVATRYRTRAAAEGRRTNPPVPVAAPAAAVTTPLLQAAPAGQPGGKLGPAAPTSAGAQTPTQAAAEPALAIRSEKLGSAAPSKDVKKHPSQAISR
jgi:hypothetical protein